MDTPDETISLISAGKVQGTNVFAPDGDKLGEIYDVMLDKRSGRIAYAVMSFGGMLGLGKRYHPLPWHALKYLPDAGGYVVGIPKEALQNGPAYEDDALSWGDGYETEIQAYYKNWLTTA
jgi:sporulation protein YlmC with PRC-barrel domain